MNGDSIPKPMAILITLLLSFIFVDCYAQKLQNAEISHDISLKREGDFEVKNSFVTLAEVLGRVKHPVSSAINIQVDYLAHVEFGEPKKLYKSCYFEARKLLIQSQFSVLDIKLGLQTVTWGETFGIPIADVVNPVDLSRTPRIDAESRKIPLGIMNLKALLGSFNLQIIYTPLPRLSALPQPANAGQSESLKINTDPNRFNLWTDAELGGKFGYLFDFGLDINAFYCSHWNRMPVFYSSIVEQRLLVQRQESRVESYGLTGSQAFDAIVLRADTVVHHNIPRTQALGIYPRYHNLWQTAFGVDYSTGEQDNFGLHFQSDVWEKIPYGLKNKVYMWGGSRVQLVFNNRNQSLEGFFLRGIRHSDSWLRVAASSNIISSWKISGEANLISQGSDGEKTIFTKRNLLSLDSTVTF